MKKNYEIPNFIITSFLAFFILQIKVSGFPILFIYIIYLFNLIKTKKKSLVKYILSILSLLLMGFLWILKSILHTGCIVYPLTNSCFKNLSWVDINYIKAMQEITIEYSLSYNFISSLTSWINFYLSNEMNKNIIFNYLLSLFIILLLIFTKLNNNLSIKENSIIIFYIASITLFYLYYGPDPRYLMGLQMLVIAILGIYTKPINIKNNFLSILLIVFSLITVPRLNDYKNFDFFLNPSIYVPQANLINLHGRYYPKEGDQCWININCSSNKENYTISNNGFYKIVSRNS